MLAASRKLDSCELLLIVFFERWSKLRYKIWARDRKSFDIYGEMN